MGDFEGDGHTDAFFADGTEWRIVQSFSPLVTLTTVAVVGILFGGFAVILAIPITSAVATLIDVLVLGHDPPPTAEPRRSFRLRRAE